MISCSHVDSSFVKKWK